MKVGDKVYIKYNPHREDASEIIGTVTDFQPEAGFQRCDLAYVNYVDPWTGVARQRSFPVRRHPDSRTLSA